MDSTPEPSVEAALQQQAGFLRGLARSLVAADQDADDVLQDAWLTTLERKPRNVQNPTSWTSGLVRNLAHKLRRGERRRRARERIASGAGRSATPGPDAQLDHAETLQQVTTAVVALGEPYRSTVLARFFEGLTPSQISARDGVPLATVKSRLARGLAQLRSKLDDAHDGDRGAWCASLVALAGIEPTALAAVGGAAATTLGTASGTGVAVGIGTAMKLKYCIPAALLVLAGLALSPLNPLRGRAPDDTLPYEPVAAQAPTPRAATETVSVADPVGAAVTAARSAVPSTGSLHGRVLWSNGTEPAAHVGVYIMPWASPHPHIDRIDVETDAEGRFVVDRLPPGKVGIYGDRSGSKWVEVFAGAVAEATLRFRPGLTVEGRVTDTRGHPVPHAEVWISDSGNGSQGRLSMHADAAGEFRLRDMTDQSTVAARHAHYGPSFAHWIAGATGSTVKTTLVLAERGGAVDCIVVDQDGDPVRGAAIRITSHGEVIVPSADPDELRRTRQMAYRLRTDTEGRATAACVTPGRVDIVVAAHRGAPAKRTIELAAGSRSTCRFELQQGVTVRGVARDVEGKTLAGITVRVRGFAAIDTRRTVPNTDGSFELRGISAGTFSIGAGSRSVGSTHADLSGADGDVITWNPVIDPGRVVTGRLIDERGEPLAGWKINARPDDEDSSTSFWGQTRTEADGAFRIVCCPAEALKLQCIDKSIACKFVDAVWHEVFADGEVREYRVLDSCRATSYIEGRTVDAQGIATAARLCLERDDRRLPYAFWSEAGTGRFRVGPLGSGTYRLAMTLHGQTSALPRFELGSHATRALGDIQAGASGQLAIKVIVPEGADPESLSVHVTSQFPNDREPYRRVPLAELDTLTLAAGTYVVSAHGPNAYGENTKVEVAVGSTQTLTLHPRVGARLALDVRAPNGDPPPQRLRIRVLDAAGNMVRDRPATLFQKRYCAVLLPTDMRLTLKLSTADGLSGSCEVGPLSAQDKRHQSRPQRIDLRR